MKIQFLIVALMTVSQAQAEPKQKSAFFYRAAGTEAYQIGAEWGKKEVTPANLSQHSEHFQRQALATARYGGGTAFYLGKINGRHMMGTNHHVQTTVNCQGKKATFTLRNLSFACTRVFGSWPNIDFALFEISIPAAQEPQMNGVGRSFNWTARIYPGQELITIGHGSAGNSFPPKLVGNEDSDCKTFSGENDFRLMADPDALNPGPYRAWSFANGCDVSHGDSGSSYVDRKTGDVIGIVWTGKIPKDVRVRDPLFLDRILQDQSEEIWTELTYTVPAPKVRDFLVELLRDVNLDPVSRAAIDDFVRH